MPKLTETQALILTAAAARADRIALPLPPTLRGGAAARVVGALLAQGLLAEVAADPRAGEAVWRATGDGHGVTLAATAAGIAALAAAPEPADANDATAAATAPRLRLPRDGTKQARLIAMLRQPEGATIAEIAAATGWQACSVRGAFAGALKKRLGLTVASEKIEGRGRAYRIDG